MTRSNVLATTSGPHLLQRSSAGLVVVLAALCAACRGTAKSPSAGPANTSGASPSVSVSQTVASSAPSSTQASTIKAAGGSPSCAPVTASLVSSTLGVPAAGPRQIDIPPQGSGRAVDCTFGPDVEHAGFVRLYTGVDAATFAKERASGSLHGQVVTDVPGFQDQAFSIVSTDHGTVLSELAARKGSVEILVVAYASVDAEKTLEQRIFPAL